MEDCTHPTTEPRIRTKSNGTTSVAMQCLTCGDSRGDKPKHQFILASLKPFDEKLREDYWENRKIQAQTESEKKSAEWWGIYNEYLSTEHWGRVRRMVLDRDQQCQVCFSDWSVQAHHLTYDSFNRWGVSFAVECVGVCKDCHDKLHDK